MGIINNLKNAFGMNDSQQTSTEKKAKAPTNASEPHEPSKQEQEAGQGKKPSANKDSKKAPNKAHIHNLIIVDESGSMTRLREATLSGINETINTIRNAQKEFADTQVQTLTLVTFDSGNNRPDVRTLIDDMPITEVKDFKDYMPNGCTPLYDAMGQSLTTLHNRIKNDDTAVAVVTVLTDGLENSSKELNAKALRKLIEQLKEEGWSFAYMGSAHNVKEVTDLLSIDNVVEFNHDAMGAASTWARESSSRRAFFAKMNDMMYGASCMSAEDKTTYKRNLAKNYYTPRVTPNHIDKLEENEVFVFGSNAEGHHGGGAAAQAMHKFGAVWGQGEGLQGQSYAIPTMEGLENLAEAVKRFKAFAAEHPTQRFLVTRIGCGIAGYSDDQIAPLFKDCISLENVALPYGFWTVLGLNMQ